MILIRNVLLAIMMLLTLIVTVPIILFAGFFSRDVAYHVGASWGHLTIFFMRIIGGIDYRVTGLEHLPDSPAIICVKHQSMLEMFFILAIFGKQTWVLKKELLKVPLFGWSLSAINPIAIDRKSGKRAMEQIQSQGKAKLEAGYHIVIYPEGTRVPPLQRKPYKRGAVVLAKAIAKPLIPVAHNAGLFWHRKRFIINTGKIDIKICEPISVREVSVEEALDNLQEVIESNSVELMKKSPVFNNYCERFLDNTNSPLK